MRGGITVRKHVVGFDQEQVWKIVCARACACACGGVLLLIPMTFASNDYRSYSNLSLALLKLYT